MEFPVNDNRLIIFIAVIYALLMIPTAVYFSRLSQRTRARLRILEECANNAQSGFELNRCLLELSSMKKDLVDSALQNEYTRIYQQVQHQYNTFTFPSQLAA